MTAEEFQTKGSEAALPVAVSVCGRHTCLGECGTHADKGLVCKGQSTFKEAAEVTQAK